MERQRCRAVSADLSDRGNPAPIAEATRATTASVIRPIIQFVASYLLKRAGLSRRAMLANFLVGNPHFKADGPSRFEVSVPVGSTAVARLEQLVSFLESAT